jgi:hypothetical protein
MKSIVKYLSLIFGILLIFGACKQAGRQNTESTDQELIEKSEIEASLKDMANPLPQPFEVYNMLEEIGASYLNKVLNPVDNADNYFTQKSKSINVGVYAADLGYAATYDKKEDINVYSKTLKSLVDDLGVKVDYSSLLGVEDKTKIMDKDSLVGLISGLYYNTYKFLYQESSPSLSALMAAGAWVEGLYITTHISDDTYQNTEIVKVIFEQKKSLDELIVFLEKFQDDEMVSSLLTAFKKLKSLFDEAGDSLTKDQLNGITTTIETIRDSIIS